MSTKEAKCTRCDKPLATQADYDALPEGEGDWLCWSAYAVDCEPADWRGRAIALCAERDAALARVAALREQAGLLREVAEHLTQCRFCGEDNPAECAVGGAAYRAAMESKP